MIRGLTGVICCGNISHDIPVWPVDQFTWGTTTWVQTIQENIGGNGGNTSYALGKLGVPVRLFGMLGSDAAGNDIRALLASVGVETDHIGFSAQPTTRTVCVVNSTGDRLFLHRLGASTDVEPSMIGFSRTEPHSHFHLANLYSLPKVRVEAGSVMRRAKQAGLTTSLDTGWDARGLWIQEVGPALPYTDILFVNESESKMLTGFEDPRESAARLRELGASCVLSKRGAEGCLIFTAESERRVPGFTVDVMDTTGAGDCFAGGFLAGVHRGLSCEDAVRFANAVGALSVTRLGTVAGVLSYNETLDWMKSR